MKKMLAALLSVCLLATSLAVGAYAGLTAHAASDNPDAVRQMKIVSYTQFFQTYIKNNLGEDGKIVLVRSAEEGGVPVYNEAELALRGTVMDPWGRSWTDAPNEQTHRKLAAGQYVTFRLEVDQNATALQINDMYFANSTCNMFGVQLSADGYNFKSIGDYGSNTKALESGWKWDVMDQSWGRDGNNTSVMKAAQVVNGKKVVYMRLVAGFNNGEANGTADKPYKNKDGHLIYNNFYVDAMVDGKLTRQMKIDTYTQYWRDFGEAEYGDESGVPVYSEAYLALGGVTKDVWGRSWADAPNEQTNRYIHNGEYLTFRLELDENAEFFEINDAYYSNGTSNRFGVQLSTDNVNWLSVGDYGSNTAALGNGWKWKQMDQTWNRDKNNADILSRCAVENGKKIVYMRLVSAFNKGSSTDYSDGNGEVYYNNFYVDAVVPVLDSIAVTTLPKTVYDYKTALDVMGGKLTLTYRSGATKVIDLTADMVSGFDGEKTGEQTLTVTYGGKTTTYTVTVNDKAVTAIALLSAPTKTVYAYGEALDTAGGKLRITYSDNSTDEVELTAAMVSGFDSEKAGEQTLTVTYGGQTATFTVTVREQAVVDSYNIQIDAGDKLGGGTFTEADVLVDKSEGAVIGDKFGTVRSLPTADDYVVYKLDLDDAASHIEFAHFWAFDTACTISLSADGKSFATWATHKADGAKDMSIGAKDFDFTDGVVQSVLNNNPEKIVYVKLSGPIKMGNFGLKITTTVYPSEMKEVKSATLVGTAKTEYMIGDQLSTDGMTLRVVYTDDTEKDFKVYNYMVKGFDSSKLNDALTLTVSVGKASATYTVAIKPVKGSKTEEWVVDADGPFGLDIFDAEERAKREKDFADSGFSWENLVAKRGENTQKSSELVQDSLLAYTFFPFGLSDSTCYMNVESEGYITYAVDLNDRATKFDIAGWGAYQNCDFYASKDGGGTWYLVAQVGEKEVGLGGFLLPQAGVNAETCEANIRKVLTGNPEKKFLLKIAPGSYGKALFSNLILKCTYNVGDVEDLPLTDETLEAEKAAAAAVDALIDAIGDVKLTDDCREKLEAARKAYDALDSFAKPQVKKLADLTDAEEAYAQLAKKATDREKAREVERLIDAIGKVDYTIEARDAIIAASDAYDALTTAQKNLVENVEKLQNAMLAYSELQDAANGAEPGHRKPSADSSADSGDRNNPNTGAAVPVTLIAVAALSAGAVLTLKKRR
mgnify:FL=1